MSENMYTLAFYVLSALTIGSAAGVVMLRNLFHSALFLALTFVGVAGLYVLLSADFLAAVQILVYGGAVAVMIVLGVMLTQRGNMDESSPANRWGLGGAIVTGAFLATLIWAVLTTQWNISPEPMTENTAPAIAQSLLQEYVVPFEIAALLLTVAMIGAIILAKGAKDE